MSTLSVIDVHGLTSRPRPIVVDVADVPEVDACFSQFRLRKVAAKAKAKE